MVSHGGTEAQRRGEVLKFGSSKVLKFELAPVPNHPQVINRQDAKDAKGNREMDANGWRLFNREKREIRERGAANGRQCTRMDANGREYGVSGWSKRTV